MHRAGDGWSANVTMFGAWGQGIDHSFDWLMRAPPECAARRRMIERGHPWFSLIDLELAVAPHREVALSLHVAAITGTVWAPEVEAELLAKADAVIFYAETMNYQLERTRGARAELERWIEQRGDSAIVVFQLDTPGVGGQITEVDEHGSRVIEDPAIVLSAAQLVTELAIGSRPYVETNAREHQIGPLFRIVVQELLGARERLERRPSYELP